VNSTNIALVAYSRPPHGRSGNINFCTYYKNPRYIKDKCWQKYLYLKKKLRGKKTERKHRYHNQKNLNSKRQHISTLSVLALMLESRETDDTSAVMVISIVIDQFIAG
jgi:sarcosine oxidase delta subunit